jgi:hypothetical protein
MISSPAEAAKKYPNINRKVENPQSNVRGQVNDSRYKAVNQHDKINGPRGVSKGERSNPFKSASPITNPNPATTPR